MSDGEVQVTVLLQGEDLNSYAATALNRMTQETSAEITLAVINEKSQAVKSDGKSHLLLLRKGIQTIKQHRWWSPIVIRRKLWPPSYAKPVEIDNIEALDGTKRLKTSPIETKGMGNQLPEDVVDMIAKKSDIVIRFGFGILEGRILTAPRYGVLSYHHGDIRKYRGRAGGFWAFINDDDEAGVTLQVLTEELDGGKIAVFESVNISDARTLSDIRQRIFRASEGMLTTAIRQIEAGEFQPFEPDCLGSLYTHRSLGDVLKFTAKNMSGLFKKFLDCYYSI